MSSSPSSKVASLAAGPVTLVQLAGENVLANLLPVMALRPARVLQVRGRGERQEGLVRDFKSCLLALSREPAYAGIVPKVLDHVVQGDCPDLAETRDFVAALLLQNPGAVVNFSGGSKLMALGAYQAAVALGRPSLYADLEGQRFVNGRTGPLSHPPEFKKLMDQLSLSVLLMSAGRDFSAWCHETAPDSLKAFAIRCYELRGQHWAALDSFSKALRGHFYGQGDRLPSDEAELSALLARPLPAGCMASEPARQLLAAAVTAGLVKMQTQEVARLSCKATRRAVAQCIQWLCSGWLEVAVLDRVLRLPHYKQVHWCLSPRSAGDGDEPGYGILCLDAQAGGVRYMECLATLSVAPLEHLEAVSARAQLLGGAGARATLVVFRTAQEQVLRQGGRRLGVDVIVGGEEIVRSFTQKSAAVVQ